MSPELDAFVKTLPAAGASATVLLLTWPWRERGWPVPLALGAGYATSHVWARGWPELLPPGATELPLHFAVLAALLGVAQAVFRLPGITRWVLRAAVSAGVAYLLLRNLLAHAYTGMGERALWLGGVGGALFASWSALEWRAARIPGVGLPATMLVTAGGGAVALVLGHAAVSSGHMAGMLAAATGPLLVYAWLRPEAKLDRGGVTVYALVASTLWISGFLFADLPPWSALLLLGAPLLAARRWWLGALLAGVLVAGAVLFSHFANLPDPDDPYAGY